MKTRKMPVGRSDFREVITGDYVYVDKTLLIKEIMDMSDSIILPPRPRRFGKTLNLSMLKYFYDCCPDSKASDSDKNLFENLAIMNAGNEYTGKMGK